MLLYPVSESSTVALMTSALSFRAGSGLTRRLPARTTGPMTSPPGRLIVNVLSDASCAVNDGVPASATTTRITYWFPLGHLVTLLMSIVSVALAAGTFFSNDHDWAASRLNQISLAATA